MCHAAMADALVVHQAIDARSELPENCPLGPRGLSVAVLLGHLADAGVNLRPVVAL